MKKYWTFGSIAAMVMLGGYCIAAPVEGVVTAVKLNARIFPELKSPAVTKLYKGQKVMIFQRHGGWLEIAAPGSTPVFASAAYISGNKVVRDISLRTKPAISGPEIKRVKKGTSLKAVAEPDRYGWVRVAPTEDMRLYVVQDYVAYDSTSVPVAKKGEMPAAPALEKQEAPQAAVAPAPVKQEAPKPAVAPAPVKQEAPKAAPAPAGVKKEAPKAAPAPAGVKKEAPKAAVAPAPVKQEAPKAAVAPAPVKKEAPKAAPAQAKKFELSDEDKRELLNIGVDINAPAPYAQKGILVAVDKPSGNCTRYALADAKNGSNKGFVFAAPELKLETMVNKIVAVKGFAYRNAKWKNPVVGVAEITLAGE